MMVTVVHCKKSPYDIYIGRPSILGNPYVVGKDGSREVVVAKYEVYARERMKHDHKFRASVLACDGKVVGCWCTPKLCHGDTIKGLIKWWMESKPTEGVGN